MRKKGFCAFFLALALTVTSVNFFGLNVSAEEGETRFAATVSVSPENPTVSPEDPTVSPENPDKPGMGDGTVSDNDPDKPGTGEKTPGEILGEALAKETPDKALEILTGSVDMDTLQELMQNDSAFLDQIDRLEILYMHQMNIEKVEAFVDTATGVDIDQVKITGAAFNSINNANVALAIDLTPEEDKVQLPSGVQYQSSVQLDIVLVSDGEVIRGDLKMPVTITMPLPGGIGTEGLEILHYHGDGYDRLTVGNGLTINEDGTVTITIKNFSTFVFAQRAVREPGTDEPGTDIPVDGGNNNGGSSAGSDTSMDDVAAMIRSAASRGTVTITKADGISSLSNEVMKALVKRGDVTLVMEYTYQGKDYRIVIPAGKAVDNDIPWYGPLYLANYYGSGVAASAGAADYIVKAGDTLSRIARANGMTVAQIAAKNPQIKDVNLIYVGQKITLK